MQLQCGGHRRRRIMRVRSFHYDCDGNCLNDADGDLVCDELEVDGCTDEAACNYSESATKKMTHARTQRPTSTATAIV